MRFPNGASSGRMLITGVNTVCASGSCSNAPGDADLYVYGSTMSGAAPSSRAAGACASLAVGNEEACTIPTATADWYYWMCVDKYSDYNQIQVRAEFNLGTSSSTSFASTIGTWYVDYWKNNLFLGVAYHRFACLASGSAIVDEREWDGFTNIDYCRRNYGFSDPGTRGGESTYMLSTTYTSWNVTDVKSRLESCGTSTNTTYDTPSYQRRSNTCSYNILRNCNSDCWIKAFSQCERGTSIDILSPCW